MSTHSNDEAVLLELNRRSFSAEDAHNPHDLEPILSEDFRIVRSSWLIDDKLGILARVAYDPTSRTRHVDGERVAVLGDGAVVASRVTLKEPDGETVGQFWNTKVFARREGGWRCVTWQVARLP